MQLPSTVDIQANKPIVFAGPMQKYDMVLLLRVPLHCNRERKCFDIKGEKIQILNKQKLSYQISIYVRDRRVLSRSEYFSFMKI